MTRSISSARPITGSSLPSLALLVQGDAVALQKFTFSVGLPLFFLSAGAAVLCPADVLLGSKLAAVVEQAVQKREGSGLAGFLVHLSPPGRSSTFSMESIACIISLFKLSRSSSVMPMRCIISFTCGSPRLLGALQAQTLVNGLVPLHPGDEHRGNILFTSGTKCWLHSYLRTPRSARRSIGKL